MNITASEVDTNAATGLPSNWAQATLYRGDRFFDALVEKASA